MPDRWLTVIVFVLVVILALIVCVARARASQARASQVAPQITGGGVSSPPAAAQKNIRRYAFRAIVPTLRKNDKSVFARALDRAMATPDGRSLGALRKILRRGLLSDTGAGTGSDVRAARRAEAVKHALPDPDAVRGPYLDIGCGDGSITRAIANAVGISSIYCAEVGPEPRGFPQDVQRMLEGPDGSLPFEDGQFGFVTALMVLHHVDPGSMPKLAAEIARVTRPGGVLVLREHDLALCGEGAAAYIDWIHILFDLTEGVAVEDLRPSHYRTPAEWEKMLSPWFVAEYRKAAKDQVCSYFSVFRRRVTPTEC